MNTRWASRSADEIVDALAARGLGLDDRHAPVAVGCEREHAADLAHHRVGERVVGLVDRRSRRGSP